jgi:hypothetical protein
LFTLLSPRKRETEKQLLSQGHPTVKFPSLAGYHQVTQPFTLEAAALYTVPVKSLDTPTHSRVFLYFYYFIHCRIIVKTSKQ